MGIVEQPLLLYLQQYLEEVLSMYSFLRQIYGWIALKFLWAQSIQWDGECGLLKGDHEMLNCSEFIIGIAKTKKQRNPV